MNSSSSLNNTIILGDSKKNLVKKSIFSTQNHSSSRNEFKNTKSFRFNTNHFEDVENDIIIKNNLENKIFRPIKDKMKILIVDDHKLVRKALKNLCEEVISKYSKKEYEILEANDGIELLYRLMFDQSQNNLIKCIITDENMEYMNGSQATKIVRKLEKFNKIKYIPIASITAFDSNKMKEFLIKKGIDFILSKPCSRDQLKEFFEKFVFI